MIPEKHQTVNLLDEAVAYHRRGLKKVIPTCGKKAACRWKQYQQAGPTAVALEKLFQRPGIDGLAVILGDGLACRDFDVAESYHRWRDSHADLAAILPTVQTARGYHLYFRGPDGFRQFPDGEYRADPGHYCLLPPSKHPTGKLYRWLVPLPEGELPAINPEDAGLLLVLQEPLQETNARDNARATQATQLHCVSLPGMSQIVDTLPSGPGQRNRCIFRFARRLKAIMPTATPAQLRPLMLEWHRQALPIIRTKDFQESWQDFQVAWMKVKKPYVAAVLSAAFASAAALPEPPIDGRLELGLLAAACRELHCNGGTPFYLSARAAAKHLGMVMGESVSAMTAWRWLEALQFFGVIASDEIGSLSRISEKAGSPMTATTWHFLGVQTAAINAQATTSPTAASRSLLPTETNLEWGPYGEKY